MHSRTAVFAAALVMAPLGADLVGGGLIPAGGRGGVMALLWAPYFWTLIC